MPSGEPLENAAKSGPVHLLRTILALVGASVASGVMGAAFVWALSAVTVWRQGTPQVIWLLPLAGWLLGTAYTKWAGAAARGTGLVVEALRRPNATADEVPARMAPAVVLGTLWTHAFGGSAGREGTAMQMGASLATTAARVADVPQAAPLLLPAGIAAGFGAVFGTPWAAAIFALELGGWRVPTLWRGLVCVGCAWLGHGVALLLRAPHAHWPQPPSAPLLGSVVVGLVALGLAVALAVRLFLWSSRQVHTLGSAAGWSLATRMAVGGLVVVALWQAVGTDAYLGLGIDTIVASTHDRVDSLWVPVWKLVFTSVTVGSGFIGGEVTPLFFVGATLGSYASPWIGAPPAVTAGAGLAGAFAAAAHTPLAMIVMAAELFGVAIVPHAAVVCVVAWLATRPAGLFPRTQVQASASA